MQRDDFSSIDLDQLRQNRQWQLQYRLLMQWGNCIKPKEALRQDSYKIRGCSASAWMTYDHGFYFDSESRIMNGLSALLFSQIERTPADALTPNYWKILFHDLGLEKHLSPSRNNGFSAILRQAIEYAAQNQRF